MIYGSVCSGIEAASVAWSPLGWRAAWLSEIEKFPNLVLAHHYPDIPNLGDMTKIHANQIFQETEIDLIVGGTPCQSFSVAGLRKGLADPRGNLCLEFLRLVDQKQPRWFLWENVPGVLSSSGGRDFGSFLGAIQKLGYGFAYRVLDAQYFGVPQRRRRVFVVGYLGDARPASAVLFERESLLWDPQKGRKTRKAVAALTSTGVGTCGADDNQAQAGHLIQTFDRQSTGEYGTDTVASTVSARDYKSASDLITIGFNHQENFYFRAEEEEEITNPLRRNQTEAVCVAFQTRGSNIDLGQNVTGTINSNADRASGSAPCVAFTQNQSGDVLQTDNVPSMGTNQNATGRNTPKVYAQSQVRRLTPRECERLQGFPDDYTLLPNLKKPADGPRYKALGNSMAVPVMRWIGTRIQQVEEIIQLNSLF